MKKEYDKIYNIYEYDIIFYFILYLKNVIKSSLNC